MVKWVAKQSGHPKGRRRRTRRLADLLREIGDEQVQFEDGPPEGAFDFGEPKVISVMSRRERMVRVLWTEALDGNLRAAQLIAAYTDGRPVQPVAVGVEVHFTADEYGQAAAMVAEWRAARGSATTVADQHGQASGSCPQGAFGSGQASGSCGETAERLETGAAHGVGSEGG